jgi:hypothetical protein
MKRINCWTRLAFLHNGVADVGAVKTADKERERLQLQVADNVLRCQRIGGGGERDPRHARVALMQAR